MKSTDMKFTEELRRRRAMNPEELAKEVDEFFISKHYEFATGVEDVLCKKIKGLEPDKIKHEAWQIVGWFQEYMEHGAFCLPGERVGLNETGRAPLHTYRMGKRDLQAVDNTFKKALKGVHDLTNDVGAWEEFQRRLWEIADADDKKSTRQDLWVLQALSGLEMISKTIEDMHCEGTLFKRGNWIIQKARRTIIIRLAFLYEWSNEPHPNTLLALQKYLRTMTKTDDWGAGKETSGDIFIQFVKDVFKALGLTDNFEEAEISGTTIRSDILDAIEELNRGNNFLSLTPENP